MTRVLSIPELALAARDWRAEGAVVVLACGCWDPLHLGHVQHLDAARALGNVLVVGVASDRAVRAAKQRPGGPARPLLPADARAGVVAGLRCVDAAAVNDDTPALLAAVRPHVYAKGAEYRGNLTPALQAEVELLDRLGGRLAFVSGPRVMSSTAVLDAAVTLARA